MSLNKSLNNEQLSKAIADTKQFLYQTASDTLERTLFEDHLKILLDEQAKRATT